MNVRKNTYSIRLTEIAFSSTGEIQNTNRICNLLTSCEAPRDILAATQLNACTGSERNSVPLVQGF